MLSGIGRGTEMKEIGLFERVESPQHLGSDECVTAILLLAVRFCSCESRQVTVFCCGREKFDSAYLVLAVSNQDAV